MRPQARYEELVARGTIRADAAQEGALAVYERLYDLLAQKPSQPPAAAKRGFFSRFRSAETNSKPEPHQNGAYIFGGVGTGKSMLMDLFYETVPEPRRRRVHFHAFMQEIHEGMHKARQQGVEDALQPVASKVIAKSRLLCFDEMQITDITDAMIVGRLFELLFAAGTIVVTTSNRHPDELYKDGLNRQLFLPFIEQIKSHMEVHNLDGGTDFRQARLSGHPVYFTPDDYAAKAEVENVWKELTGNHSERLVLHNKGREIILPRYWNGTARATFDEICGQPLGPGDYLTLAEALRVLIVEGIPELTRERANDAKRFVTLIDALYEAKVKFIASAETEPEDIYNDGPGAFEFERTASRLREMQGADWGR